MVGYIIYTEIPKITSPSSIPPTQFTWHFLWEHQRLVYFRYPVDFRFDFCSCSCIDMSMGFSSQNEWASLPYYLPMSGGRVVGCIHFLKVLVLCEMQTTSSSVWIRVADFISTNTSKNSYTFFVFYFRWTWWRRHTPNTEKTGWSI